MIIRPYTKRDRSSLQALLDLRSMPTELVDDLPEFGLVAIENDVMIAAGFIRKIEGMDAFLDSYISNPVYSPETRHIALDRITTKLIGIAKYEGVRHLYAFSADSNTQCRANTHGFIDLKTHLFQALRLN